MKTLIKIIISASLIFSIVTPSFAKEGYIEQLLDINYGIESYDIELASLDNYYFYDNRTNQIYKNFKEVAEVLKNEIIWQYRTGKLGYYQTKGIITNYKNFIYYSNKFFYYIKQKEYYRNNKEFDNAVLSNYTALKSYYMRLKFLVN